MKNWRKKISGFYYYKEGGGDLIQKELTQRYHYEIDYSGKICLVVGSEGYGVSRLIKEHSDYIAKIPLNGKIDALNANIATAVFLAQITSNRNKK